MRKALFLLIIIWSLGDLAFSQAKNPTSNVKDPKSNFDIRQDGEPNRLKSARIDESAKMLRNQVWEYSLMQYGYFTIGTNNGISDQIIDDKCDITFGHPFSMTSFPYPIIDGNKILPFDLPSNSFIEVNSQGDTLFLEHTTAQQLLLNTFIYTDHNGELRFEYEIINGDSISHQVGMGLLFDAALGRWGDGFIEMENVFLDSVSHFRGGLIDSLIIWERKDNPKGLGIQLDFDTDVPDDVVCGNWYDEYYNDSTQDQLYDLAIHAKWEESELMPGDTLGFGLRFSLPIPDYNNQPFIRWDMPYALSIENQLLFPTHLYSNVEIIHNSEMGSDFTLNIAGSDNVYGWESEESFSLSDPGDIFYQQADVRIPEIFDSLVIPVTLQLLKSGNIVDQIPRNIFIPSAPFSNDGLEVVIDTAYITNGRVNISFYSSQTETGQLLYNLHKNNVFLFDNDGYVEDFEIEKDTSGGVNNSDIIFVLDVTGSMSEEIAGVRNNILEFTDSLSYRGIDFRLGMVTFLDIIENIYDFTSDVQEFQMNVSAQYAHGGGDGPENSLDALSAAAQFNFRENSNRMIIWITDADFHISDDITQQTKEAVVNQLLAVGIQVHCIGDPAFQTNYYDQITMNTGGSFFDIYGNFRDILLEVSRLNQASNYLLSFYRSKPVMPGDVFKIEVHYAGLGGYDIVSIGTNKKSITAIDQTRVSIYPNPFINNTTIAIKGSEENIYEILLYNINGQLLQSNVITEKSKIVSMSLDDFINPSVLKPAQVYLLKINTLSPQGELIQNETFKIGKF